MNTIITITRNTFKETIRDRILYSVTFLGILYMIFIFFLSTISLDQGARVVTDFGLVGILFFGIAISIFIGANLLYKEIIGGTALILFPKPISKMQYIIGKFFGLVATIILVSLILTIIFMAGFWLQNHKFPQIIVYEAIAFSILETLIIVALTILFGSFSNPISSSLYSLALFLVGHSYSLIVRTALMGGNKFVIGLSKVIYYVFPNLEKFNLRVYAVHDIAVAPGELLSGLLYAAIYITFLLFVAIVALKKREF